MVTSFCCVQLLTSQAGDWHLPALLVARLCETHSLTLEEGWECWLLVSSMGTIDKSPVTWEPGRSLDLTPPFSLLLSYLQLSTHSREQGHSNILILACLFFWLHIALKISSVSKISSLCMSMQISVQSWFWALVPYSKLHAKCSRNAEAMSLYQYAVSQAHRTLAFDFNTAWTLIMFSC